MGVKRRPEYADAKGKFWSVYLAPWGDWAATAPGWMADGFHSKQEALEWVCRKMDEAMEYWINRA